MTDTLYETIKNEIRKLPQEKQEAINAFEWILIVEKIANKYNLSYEETESLQLETGFVLMGLLNMDIYIMNIENIGMSKERAETIAKEIFNNVFLPITNKMESSVKNKIKNQNIKWSQSVDFIVSGGDYSIFLDKQNG